MPEHPFGIREAFVVAYPQYVAAILTERGIEMEPVIADGIVIGTGVLDGLLAALEAMTPGLASRSPLELFREALRPVDRALDVAGVEPPKIEANQRQLLSWDRYALSPGSSLVLGATAHEAHIRWGIAKAQAFAAQPTAGLRCLDVDAPLFLSQFDALGYRVLRLPSTEDVSVGLVDIDEGDVDSIISDLATAGAFVVAFGVDPDDLEQIRYKALGAAAVVPKRMILDDLASHIPAVV
jgi:hypothetical protein